MTKPELIEVAAHAIAHQVEADLIGESFAPADPEADESTGSSAMERFVDAAAALDVSYGAAPHAVGLSEDNRPEAVEVQEAEAVEAVKPIQRATFTTPRKELAEAIRLASDGTARRSPRPALKTIRLSVNGWIHFDSFDGEQSTRLNRDYDRSGEAEILVDPKRFSAALKSIKSASVDVDIVGEELTVGPSTIPADCDIDQFPAAGWEFGPSEIRAEWYVDGATFAAAVNRTVFATDAESSRWALAGVLLECNADEFRLVATDTRRLSVVDCGRPINFAAAQTETASYVVPIETLSRVAKCIGKSTTRTVRIVAHESAPIYNDTPVCGIDSDGKPTEEKHKPDAPGNVKRVSFIVQTADGPQEFSTLLIEGRFPRYRDIIPQNFGQTFTMLACELMEAVKPSIVCTHEESRGVDFNFNSARSVLTIDVKTTAGKYHREMQAAPDSSGNVSATFDPRYIVEFLESIPAATLINWRFVDPSKPDESPAVIEAEECHLRYVVMPLSRD